jgi:hypothetical protein
MRDRQDHAFWLKPPSGWLWLPNLPLVHAGACRSSVSPSWVHRGSIVGPSLVHGGGFPDLPLVHGGDFPISPLVHGCAPVRKQFATWSSLRLRPNQNGKAAAARGSDRDARVTKRTQFAERRPLSGVKRTWVGRARMSANDPKRTSRLSRFTRDFCGCRCQTRSFL